MIDCPPASVLADWLAERLPAGEGLRVDDHIEVCVVCQQVVTNLMESDVPTRPTRDRAPPAAGGRYTLGGEIARGGMGAVYRATDTVLNREVAVKALLDAFAPTAAAASRFADEARVTGQLQHPNIPPVHDLGTLPDGRPFLAMKLIRGRTLDELLRLRPDPSAGRSRFLAAFEQVCLAVAYAHSHGVIHRDLKPQNVMVGDFGEVQVMDWGLAKVLSDDGPVPRGSEPPKAGSVIVPPADPAATRTLAGSVLGTPAYMPPEQAAGSVGQVDRRSDVFGLGGVLAVILTGKPPFTADDAEAVRVMAAKAWLQDCFARLDGCGAGSEWVALCKRCLAAVKEDRPADAGSVAEAVSALRQAADERARRAEEEKAKAEVRADEQRRRGRLRLAVVGLATVLLSAAGGFAWYADRQAADERARKRRNGDAVAELLDQAAGGMRAGEAARAGAVLEAAERRMDDGGAEAAGGRLARLRLDLVALRDLDLADRFRLIPDGPRAPDPAKVAANYQRILASYGVDPDTGPGDAAERVAASAVRDRLVAALDRVLRQTRSASIRTILRAVDPNRFRDVVRDAWRAGEPDRLPALLRESGASDQPAVFVAVLGEDGAVPVPLRRALLAEAIRRQPGDLALLMAMGNTFPLNRSEGTEERVRWFQAAVAVAPENPSPHTSLGTALSDRGELDEAIACYRKALRLDPTYAVAHNNLGVALERQGDLGGALRHYREAVRLDPSLPRAHNNLGWVLRVTGDLGRAIPHFQEAVRLEPGYALAHHNLAVALERAGDLAGAIPEYREVLRLAPKRPDAAGNLARAERMRELLPRLTGVLAGTDRPADVTDTLAFAELCRLPPDPRFVSAVRLFERAFSGEQELPAEAGECSWYHAACSAARASRDGRVDGKGRAAMRAKALTWLRKDVAYWGEKARSADSSERQRAANSLVERLGDAALSETHPDARRDGWAAEEAEAWDRLWAEVKTLVASAGSPRPRTR